jgi:hypothetical protein
MAWVYIGLAGVAIVVVLSIATLREIKTILSKILESQEAGLKDVMARLDEIRGTDSLDEIRDTDSIEECLQSIRTEVAGIKEGLEVIQVDLSGIDGHLDQIGSDLSAIRVQTRSVKVNE